LGLFNRVSDLTKEVSVDASTSGTLDSKLVSKIQNITGLLSVLSPIKSSVETPREPSTLSGILTFAKNAASAYKEYKQVFASEVLPPIDKVLAVTASKQPDAALDEFASNPAYGTISGASAVSQARVQMLKVNNIISQIEESDLEIIDSRLESRTYNALPTDAQSFEFKANHAIESLFKMSPNSYIAHSGNVQMHMKLVHWRLHTGRYGVGDYSQNVPEGPTRLGTTPAGYNNDRVYNVPGATSVLVGSAEDSPLGVTRVFYPKAVNLDGFASFPPKQDCYSYELMVDLKVQSTAAAVTGFINVAAGSMLPGDPGSFIEDRRYKWNFDGAGLPSASGLFKFAIPMVSGRAPCYEMWYSAPAVTAVTMTTQSDITDIIGTPISHKCPQSEIDYKLAGETGRRFLQSGDRWSSLLGRVDRDIRDDPNYGLRALWHARASSDSGLIEELVDAALKYSGAIWGSSIGAPSVDDKYSPYGVTLKDLSNLHSWLYSDGVFAGKTAADIDALLDLFVKDIEFIVRASQSSDLYHNTLVNHNGFSCRCG
jgi:hypothetical protein